MTRILALGVALVTGLGFASQGAAADPLPGPAPTHLPGPAKTERSETAGAGLPGVEPRPTEGGVHPGIGRLPLQAFDPLLGAPGSHGLPLLAPPGGRAGRRPPPVPEDEDDDPGGEIAQPGGPGATPPRAAGTRERTLLRKRTIPPFWLSREYETHTTTALTLPPLYLHRAPKAGHEDRFLHLDLALTVGWWDRNGLKKRVINPAALFFGSFSESRTGWAAIPLLMGYKRVGDQFRFGQFPLAWWWGSRYTKNFLAVPLHYQQRSPEGFRGVSALLFWYGHQKLDDADPYNDRRHFVGAPLYYSFTRGPKRFDFGLLYVGGKNEDRGVRHRTVWPFVHWSTHEFGNRKELWTLGWIQRSDRARQRSAWAVPLALSFRSENGPRTLRASTPLVWRATDSLRGSTLDVVGPVGVYRDPRQRAQWVAPLYLRFVDLEAGASASAALPLYFARRNDEGLTVHTLLGYAKGGPRAKDGPGAKGGPGADAVPAGGARSWGVGLHPALTYLGRRPDGRAHALVAGGLFWRFSNPSGTARDGRPLAAEGGRSAWGIGPLVYRARIGKDRHFGVMPLVATGVRDGTRYQMVTPLAWHARNPEAGRDTWVVGPGYMHRRGAQWQAGLVPLYFGRGGDDRSWHFAPLLLSGHFANKEEGWRRTVTPLFVRGRSHDGSLTSAAWLYWDVRRGLGAGAGERDTVFAPLYYRRQRGATVTHFTPLGAIRSGPERTVAATLLGYGYRSEAHRGFGVAPLLFHDRALAGDNPGATTVLAPFYARHRRQRSDLDMWSPLVWRTAHHGEAARRNLLVLPFYGRQRQPGGVDIDGGFPWFYSRDATRRTHTLIAGPFFHRLSREALHTGVAPISWWTDSETERRLITLPLIWHFETKATGERTTVAFPLWFDRIQPNGRRFWFAFPFVAHNKGQFNYSRVGVAAAGYVDIFRLTRRRQPTDGPTSYRFRGWVPFYYRYDACGFRSDDDPECRYTVRGSFPFFMMGKDGKGRRTHAVSVLYYHDRTPEGRKLYTPLGGFANQPGKRFMAYGLTFAVDTTNEWRTVTFLPIFWDKKNRIPDRDVRTTWVLPPLYIGQHKDDRRWFQSSLLFWQFRTPVKVSTTVLPPVFFLQQAYEERSLHWLLPLYLRDNHRAKDTAWTWVFPALYAQKRVGENSTAVQVPFLWHFVRGDRQTTVGVPLWYDVRRGENKTQVVPLLYAGRTTAERRTHVVGPFLGMWSRSQPDEPEAFHWRALFGIAGGGHEAGERYGQAFWIKFRLGDRAAAKAEARAERRAERIEARAERRAERLEARALRQAERREAHAERRTERSASR